MSARRAAVWLRLVILAVVAISCAACVSIPDSSPVSKAENVNVGDQSEPVSITPAGPKPGDMPAEIVSGFFEAMLAYPQSSAVARQFLTPGAAVSWDPRARTVVYTGPGTLTESGNVISVQMTQLGSMNARGAWQTAAATSKTMISSFRLQQVDGEWRISNPEQGSFINTDYFERNFFPYSLYFIDPTQQWLTPDPVHLVVGDTTATALVSDLLLGPSPELAGAATNVVPAGTKLDAAVSISAGGVAEVPLTPEFLQLSDEDRGLFGAQLAWTLRQLPSVRLIRITVDGAPVKIDGADQTFRVDAFAGRDPVGIASDRRLYALGKTGLVAVEPTDVTAVPGPIGDVAGGRTAAVNPNGQLGAVVSADGTSVQVGGMTSGSDQNPTLWYKGENVLKPSWDQHGLLWLVDRTGRNGARVLAGPEGRIKPVQVDGVTGEDVVSFAVSSDGVRLAAVVRNRDASRLVVAVIDRSGRAANVSVRPARVVHPAQFNLSRMSSLAWASPTEVAVLGTLGSRDTVPYALAIDGSSIAVVSGLLPAVPTTLAAGASDDVPLVVSDSGGQVYGQTPDLRWEKLGGVHKLLAPTYPG